MGFFSHLRNEYGQHIVTSMKKWKSHKETNTKLTQQLRFLLRCRQENLIPHHLDSSNINKIQINNPKNLQKLTKTLNLTFRKIINIEIDDINAKIKINNKKIRKLFETINNTLENNVTNDFLAFESQRLNKLSNKYYHIMAKKLQNLRNKKYQNIHRYNHNTNDYLQTMYSQRHTHTQTDNNANNTTTDTNYNNDNTPQIPTHNNTLTNHKLPDKWLVNLSDKTIPNHIQQFLSLGQKFCFPPSQKQETTNITQNIIAEFESRSYLIADDKLDEARGHLSQLLNKLKTTNYQNSKNLNQIVSQTKKFIRNNNDILITRADKGNTTVILNKSDYIEKTNTLLEDQSVYNKINKFTITTLQKSVEKILDSWTLKKIINEETRKILKPDNCHIARLYTLPKIHKTNFPHRPIVSSINFPTYKLANFIQKFITGSLPKYPSETKDSFTLKEILNNTIIPNDYVLVSFDVTSLYTNIPLTLVTKSLEKRNDLFNTKLNITEIKRAVNLIMNTTYFTFNEQIYKQISGLPMGSPLAPILSHLVMVDLEEECLSKLKFNVPLYKRYVDDIIIALPINEINSTLHIFNSYHPNLKFTIEHEINNSIAFLDLYLTRENNKITTNWYRKPTWSGRLINFFSHHPFRQKIGIIYMLVDRAIKLSNEKHWSNNIKLIKDTLLANQYPPDLINKKISERLNTIKSTGSNTTTTNFDITRIMNFPYVEKIHQPLFRLLKTHEINLVNNNKHNIHTITGSTKDKIPKLLKPNVIYSIPCKNCPGTYIGQTKRYLKTRIQEHKNSLNHLQSDHTALTRHVKNTKHTFDFEKTKILDTEPFYKKRLIKEMTNIKLDKNSVNYRTDISKLSLIYNSVLS